jgi:hypothetical protein
VGFGGLFIGLVGSNVYGVIIVYIPPEHIFSLNKISCQIASVPANGCERMSYSIALSARRASRSVLGKAIPYLRFWYRILMHPLLSTVEGQQQRYLPIPSRQT